MQFAVVLGDSRPHFRRRAYHFVQRSGFCACARFRLLEPKKASHARPRGNVRTDIVGIRALLRVLVERAVPAGPAGQPRGAHDTPAAALAQRLRGVVVDGRIDCPAQTSAFSDAAMSWFASRSLTSRDRRCGGVCASRRLRLSGSRPRLPSPVRARLESFFRTANPITLVLLRGPHQERG